MKVGKSIRWAGACALALALPLSGCGGSGTTHTTAAAPLTAAPAPTGPGTTPLGAARTTPQATTTPGTPKTVRQADAKAKLSATPDDTEAGESYATPASVKLTQRPPSPGAASKDVAATKSAAVPKGSGGYVSPGAPSDAEVAAELKQMQTVQRQEASAGGNAHGITLEPDGLAKVAAGVPAAVARLVAGANAIAKYPYVYGGGHASFVDTAYDCSGSLSYALAAAGFLDATKTSGELARTGAKGPGKWITIYANEGHTFMYVDGLRYDTSGRAGPLGTRWQTAPRNLKGFVVRHPPGY